MHRLKRIKINDKNLLCFFLFYFKIKTDILQHIRKNIEFSVTEMIFCDLRYNINNNIKTLTKLRGELRIVDTQREKNNFITQFIMQFTFNKLETRAALK